MNRLGESASPYLRQHADNPVDWQEWGPAAFEEAKARDVPVFLSVGYSACHWCHVMAHESFEDEAVAEYLNEHFVSIKVDREERPDVDTVYMRATQTLTGGGGWPMSVFLDHDARAFYAGTYFPPAPSRGMASFHQVLSSLSELWLNDRPRLVTAAQQVTDAVLAGEAMVGANPTGGTGGDLSDAELRSITNRAVVQLRSDFDAQHAGFGGSPKFPPSMVLEFLLRHHGGTGDSASLDMVSRTCQAMARGGLYDQLGGGFARYCVDDAWVVPHYEKMLYDNAQLLRAYLHWWRTTQDPLALRVVQETADFLIRDLLTSEGGFASALDADSDAVEVGQPREGAFYVWDQDQIRSALSGDDVDWAIQLLKVTPAGTADDGYSVLQLLVDPNDWARWERIRGVLFQARSLRPAPGRDDKIVAAWNGLAISALAETAVLLDRPDLLTAATGCAQLIADVHMSGSGADTVLRRVSMDGRVGEPLGVLEDYGDVAAGFTALYQATGDPHWLGMATDLADSVAARFTDPAGELQDSDTTAASLFTPISETSDNAYPSGASAMTEALISLGALTGSNTYRTAAADSLSRLAASAGQHARFYGWALAGIEARLAGPLEVAITSGTPTKRAHLQRTAMSGISPGLVVAVQGESSDDGTEPALLQDRPRNQDQPLAFVCQNFTCQLPTSDPAELAELVGGPVDA